MRQPHLIYRVDDDTLRQLEALALREASTKSELARLAVKLFLEANPVSDEDLAALDEHLERKASNKKLAAQFKKPDGQLESLRRGRDSNP